MMVRCRPSPPVLQARQNHGLGQGRRGASVGARRAALAGRSAATGIVSRADERVALLFDWYRRSRLEPKSTAPGDLIASFWDELTPVLWPIGEDHANGEAAAPLNHPVEDGSRTQFVKPPLAQPEPGLDGVVVLTLDSAGVAVVTAAEATHDRERALSVLPRGDDPAVASLRQFATERMPSGRRDGVSPGTGKEWRKSHDNVAITRALVARGLIDLGSTHRGAVREWLKWEHELGGEYGDREVFDALETDSNRVVRPYLDRITAANRRVWTELDPNLHPKADPGRPHDAGHEPVPPGRTQRKP